MDDTMRKIQLADVRHLQIVSGRPDEEAPPALEAACPICDDVGFFKKAVPHGHPDFARLFPCSCRRADKERERAADLLQRSNLGELRTKTFDTFDPFVRGVGTAYQQARAFAREPEGWLVLFGAYGCGKTHLAAAIAVACLELPGGVYFATCPDLLDQLRSTFDQGSQTSYSALFEAIRNVRLLVLDDLTTESPTAFALEKLFQLLNHRYNHRLATVITCNTRIDDPLFVSGPYARLMSRMRDQAITRHGITVLDAADYRARETREAV